MFALVRNRVYMVEKEGKALSRAKGEIQLQEQETRIDFRSHRKVPPLEYDQKVKLEGAPLCHVTVWGRVVQGPATEIITAVTVSVTPQTFLH